MLIDVLIDVLIHGWQVALQLLFSIPGITIALLDAATEFFLQKSIVTAIRPGRKTRFVEFCAPILNTIYCCTTTPIICLET
ncbi:hypothetical protein [Microcoleus sp. D2_18a_D3]|uniref:hypothetical protein n=1 Tax=Microcoleus sp. D2_18a_D3 TaxID=3055330 RepID=UPI002FD2584A